MMGGYNPVIKPLLFFVLSFPSEIFKGVNIRFGQLLETISSLFWISLQEEKDRKNDKNNTLNH